MVWDREGGRFSSLDYNQALPAVQPTRRRSFGPGPGQAVPSIFRQSILESILGYLWMLILALILAGG